MKVAATKETGFQKKPSHILPLREDIDETYTLDKSNSVTWELSTRPGEADAATYKFLCRVLQGDETPRQILRWRSDVIKVCVGLNVTTLEARRPIMTACMRSGPLAAFNGAVNACARVAYNTALAAAVETDRTATATARAANPRAAAVTADQDAVRARGVDHCVDDAHLDQALQLVVANYLPKKVLARVKREIRRDMRKPSDMKVRQYYQNLIRLNDEEVPELPPFHPNQKLSPDELLDVLLFGTPRSWQNEMDRQNFDPIEKGLHETVDFMEAIELTEDRPQQEKAKSKASTKKKKTDTANKKAPVPL